MSIKFKSGDRAHFFLDCDKVSGLAHFYDSKSVTIFFDAYPVNGSRSSVEYSAKKAAAFFGYVSSIQVTTHKLLIGEAVYGFKYGEENQILSKYDNTACAVVIGGKLIVIRPGMSKEAVEELHSFHAKNERYKEAEAENEAARAVYEKQLKQRKARPKKLSSLAKDLLKIANDGADMYISREDESGLVVLTVDGVEFYYKEDSK